MKKKLYIFYIFSALLILLAVTGVFENRALGFVTKVSEKNIGFMGALAEIKLVLSSISSTKVPFLSGETEEVNRMLDKAQNYLFYVNIISIVQVMLLTISKSLILKIGIAVLFFLSFFKSIRRVCVKLLIIVLAFNPGLAIYSIVVQELSKEASIDFGSNYQTELQAIVSKIQQEKAQLMQEHAKNLTQINNGEKGVEFFKRLKEDVSYDVQKAKMDIKGDYTQIRLLVKDAGHNMLKKIFIFCTTVLFCLLILPVGYSFLVYVIYKSVYQKNLLGIIETDANTIMNTAKGKGTLLNKVVAAAKAAKNEFKNSTAVNEIKADINTINNSQEIKTDLQNVLSKDGNDVVAALKKTAPATKSFITV